MTILLDLAEELGLSPKKVGATNGGEYHSACPSCGGNDRFIIQPNKKQSSCYGSYFCRKCQIHGDSIQFCREFLGLSFQEAVKRVQAVLPERSLLYKKVNEPSFKPQGVTKPSRLWIDQANKFVDLCVQEITNHDEVIDALDERGIPIDAILDYKIGFCTKEIAFCTENNFRNMTQWGLSEVLKEDKTSKSLYLPEGIVIPSLESNGDVVRLKIRRSDYKKGDQYPKYVAVAGSMNGLNIIGSFKPKIMIVVESELDAYALNHSTSDIALTVAVGSNTKNPDNVTDYLAKSRKCLLICHDNDEGGEAMKAKWCRLYPHAIPYPTPYGKDIGDAIKNGLNVRKWVLEAIFKNLKNFEADHGSKDS